MAKGATVANAFVQIMPSMEGATTNIASAIMPGISAAGTQAGTGFGQSFMAAGKKIVGMGAAALGIASIGAELGRAVEVGKQFDKAISQVAATMGKSTEEMASEVGSVDLAWGSFSGTLRDFAQEMGAHTAFSATQAAEALNYMALAGYDAQTSMNMLPSVLSLAAAGNIELARASDMVTDAQSALGLNLDETSAMVDQMAMASSKTNTSVAQLGDAFLKIGGTARNMSGGTQELATVLGILANSSIKGAEGGTHLRNIILSLASPTEDAAEALESLGVSVFDADGKMRPMVDIFGDLSDGMADMTDEGKLLAKSAIFNKTDLAAVDALLNTQAEDWRNIDAAIGDAAGSAEKMANTQLDNLAGDVTLFESAMEGLRIKISDFVTPALRTFVEGATALVTFLTENVPPAFEFVMGVMQPFVDFIVQNVFPLAQEAYAIMSPVLSQIQSTVQNVFGRIWNVIQSVMGFITGLISYAWPYISEAIKAATSVISSVTSTAWSFISSTIENAVGAIQTVIDIVFPIIKVIVETVFEAIGRVAETVWPVVSGIVETATFCIQTAIEQMQPIIDKVAEIFNGVKEALEQPIGTAKDFVDAAAQGIQLAFESLQPIFDTVSRIFDGVKSAIEDPIGTARDFIDEAVSRIRGFFEFDIQWPHIPLPHFSVSGSPNPLDWITQGVPSIGIEWYAKGGFMDSPVLFGGGEAGAEMVLPRRGQLMDEFANEVASHDGDEELIRWLSANLGRIIAQYAPSMTRREFDRMARQAIA